jgi:hypothetical protein
MKKTYYSISEICEYFPVKKKQQNYAIIINYKERKKERKTGYSGVGRCLNFKDRRAKILGWSCRGSTSLPGLSYEDEVGASEKFEK